MCILSKYGGKKALLEASIHIYHNFISGMHTFKHFYSSIYCQHNHQCLTQDNKYKCMRMQVCIPVKIYKMMENSLSLLLACAIFILPEF